MGDLFINISPPNLWKKMPKLAISSTIKMCISDACRVLKIYIPSGITGHSKHGTASNLAFARHVFVEKVCRVVLWPSILTFVKHYKLNLYNSADTSFGRRVLQHIVPEDSRVPPKI